MDPFSLMIAAIAGGGKLFEGFAGSAAAELQGQIAQGNAALFDRQAEIEGLGADVARAKGSFEQHRLHDRVSRVVAGQTAHFANAGLDPASGSPLQLAMQAAMQGEADADIIRAGASLETANALTRSANTQAQATNARFQSAALKQKEFTDIVAGVFGAATAFLSPFKKPSFGDGLTL